MALPALSKRASSNRHKKILNLWKRKFGLESFETGNPDWEKWERASQIHREENGYGPHIVKGVDPVTGDVYSLRTWPDVDGRISEMGVYNEGNRDGFIGGDCDDEHEWEMIFPEVGTAKDLVGSLTKNKVLKVLRRGVLGKNGFSESRVLKFLDKLEPVIQGISGSPYLDVDSEYVRCSSDMGGWKTFTLGEELANPLCSSGDHSC